MPYKDPAQKKKNSAIWWQANKTRIREKIRANPEKTAIKNKLYRQRHMDQIKARRAAAWRSKLADNREKSRLKSAKERAEHPERVSKRQIKYCRQKRKSDPAYKLKDNCRRRIRKVLAKAGLRSSERTHVLLGCSPTFFRNYIEQLLLPGMTWDNYGKVWHIDHKKPLAIFDLTIAAQRAEAFHFSNTQPLWAPDNIRKGANYETVK